MITSQQIYALQALRCLAKSGIGEVIRRQDIAEKEGVPTYFLAKILQDLAKRGVLEIKQGSTGGPCLSKDPSEISVLEVLEICGGKFDFDRGAGGKIGEVLSIAQGFVESYLDSVKISDLVDNAEK